MDRVVQNKNEVWALKTTIYSTTNRVFPNLTFTVLLTKESSLSKLANRNLLSLLFLDEDVR